MLAGACDRLARDHLAGPRKLPQRIYRDPVHNIIPLRDDTAEGRLMIRLIDTPEFQRLRRIKQLGLGLYTYQGAEHSRFTHSLGAMHLITRILMQLEDRHSISKDDRVTVRAAALLHDVGHGPFSHAMEKVLGVHHEQMTMQAVTSEETSLNEVLTSFSAELPQRVATVIDGTFKPAALAQLVSSQLDVDRMDYLLRDSLMTGAKYGMYDLEWIINAIQIDEEADRIYIAARGVYAVEEYLQARYYMFRQVYFHRTLRSAEAVLRSAVKRALTLVTSGVDVWCTRQSAFEKLLGRKQLTIREHLSLDDSDVIFHMKQWQQSEDEVLSDLSERFVNRRLFKAIDLDMPINERKHFLNAARSVVERAGFPAEYYFIEDRASDLPYYGYYTTGGVEPRTRIYVEDGYAHPCVREISEVSQAVRGLAEGYELHRVCFPAEVKDQVYRLYHGASKERSAASTN